MCKRCTEYPIGLYHHKFHEVRGKRPPPPHFRTKVGHKGVGLYPELYDSSGSSSSGSSSSRPFQEFCQEHMAWLADGSGEELRNLAALAKTQPRAEYTVFSKGLAGHWRYHLRRSKCPEESLSALDKAIDDHFLPALLGHDVAPASGGAIRRLLALPAHFGGLAVPVFADMAGKELEASVQTTRSITDLIIPSTSVGSAQVDLVVPSEPCRLQSSLEADTAAD